MVNRHEKSHTECLQNLEPLVELFQVTLDDRYYDIIHRTCRNYIQGRAVRDAYRYGIDSSDCESVLCMSLFNAVRKYDSTKGVPFAPFANLMFAKGIADFMYREDRKDTFYSPKNSNYAHDNKDVSTGESSSFSLVYAFAQDDFDLVDKCPRADAENLIADEDSAQKLVEYISELDEAAAKVVLLKACGYSQREIATALDYNPTGVSKSAQNKWVSRKLEKCIKPVEKYYSMLGTAIPIRLKA